VVLTINATPVKNVQELQAALDSIEAGKNVAITFKSKGKEMTLEGVAKAK
jgi:S1-C subfamily serine protease